MFVVQECLKSRNLCIQEMFAVIIYMQYRNVCSTGMIAV